MILTRDQNKIGNYEHAEVSDLYTANVSEQVDMGVADGALSLILEMLSDVSSNRGAYVLREAYSNAYDATKATGDMSRRIDITIPHGSDNVFEPSIASRLVDSRPFGYKCPTVTIEDRGIGMNEDDVKRYFLQYGGSKKRDNVDAVGSKGLGSKAPLAVTDTFEVRTRQDGIETYAVISRTNDKNTASITSYPTSKPDGTTVSIPVDDTHTLYQIRDCADTLMRTNIDANLYVNGEQAPRLSEQDDVLFLGDVTVGQDADGSQVSFGIYFNRTSDKPFGVLPPDPSQSDIKVIIGGYPYMLRQKRSYQSHEQYLVIGDPGYLNFTPSRDEIKDDAARTRFIDAITSGITKFDKSGYVTSAMKDMSSLDKIVLTEHARFVRLASSPDESIELRFDWFSAIISEDMYQHNGHDLLKACYNSPYTDDERRVPYTDTHMLVITRERVSKSKNQWWVNGHYAQEGKFVNAKPMVEASDAIVPVNCFMFEASRAIASLIGKKVTNAIVTGFDFSSRGRRSMMGKFNWLARSLSKYADVAGSVIRLFCVDDEHQLDSVRDIIDGLGDTQVIDWQELLALSNNLASDSRSGHITSSNAGNSWCYVIDLSKATDTLSTINIAYDIARQYRSINTVSDQSVTNQFGVSAYSYSFIAPSVIEDSVCATLHASNDDEAGAMALVLMTLARHNMLGFKPSYAIIMPHPFAEDVRDCEAKGGRFAFDMRRGSVKHADTITIPSGVSVENRKPSDTWRANPPIHTYFTLPARLVFDGYETPRWSYVRSRNMKSALDGQPYDVTSAAHIIDGSHLFDGTRFKALVSTMCHGDRGIHIDDADLKAYSKVMGDSRFCSNLTLTDDVKSPQTLEERLSKDCIKVLRMLSDSGLSSIVSREYAYDDRTKKAVISMVGERVSETIPDAMEKA